MCANLKIHKKLEKRRLDAWASSVIKGVVLSYVRICVGMQMVLLTATRARGGEIVCQGGQGDNLG